MSNDLGVTDNDASKFDSGIDMSSFGSCESDCDFDKTELLNDKNETNQFFKEKTPEISNKVLSLNAMSSDESDSSLYDNFSPIRNNQNEAKPQQSPLSRSQDENTTPKIKKAKSYASGTPPQILQAKQQLERLMKQLESKSAQKSAELEKVNKQLLSHSAELNKYNVEIEAKLSELKRAQDQLRKIVSDSSNPSSRESSFADEETKNSSQNQIEINESSKDKPEANVQTRSLPVPISPTKAIQTSEEMIQPGSPEFKNLYQQLDQANTQLEKLQNQLQQFFEVFDPNDDGNETNMNDSDFSRLIEQVKKDKELTDSIKSNLPEITPTNIQTRSIELEPQEPSHELEKARSQLQQFFDIFNPDEDKKGKERLSDEDFEKLLNQAKKDKDLSKVVETVLPISTNISSSLQAPMNIDEITSQINNLKAKSIEFDEVQDKLKNTSEQLDSKSTELDEVQNQLKDANKQLDSKSTELDEIQNQLKNANEQLDSKSTELDTIQNQLKNANEQLDSKSTELDKIQNQLKNANEQLDSKSTELDTIQNQLRNANEQLDSKSTELDVIQNQLKNANEQLDSKSTELDKIQNQLKDANEQLDSKSTELDEIQNQLKDANEQLDSKSTKLDEIQNQLKDANEQLESKSTDLDQANKKLENVCRIIEVIEHEKLNPDQITNERLSDVFAKVKSNEEEENKKAGLNQRRMKTVSAIFNKTDDINDDEFQEMVEIMRKNKELSDTLQPSLPDNFQEKSHSLEDKSAQFDKMKQQFNLILHALDENNDRKNSEDITDEQLTEIVEKVRKDKQIADVVKASFDEKLTNPDDVREKIENLEEKSTQLDKVKQQFNSVIQAIGEKDEINDPDEITDDQLDKIIEKVEKDKEISEKVQSSLPPSSLNKNRIDDAVDEFIEKAKQNKSKRNTKIKTRAINLDNDNYDENSNDTLNDDFSKAQRRLDEFVNIFGQNDNNENENDRISDNLNNQRFNEILKNAKKELEISQAVRKTLPRHSSCGEEVQVTINILKLRSAKLDSMLKQNKEQYSKLKKRLDSFD